MNGRYYKLVQGPCQQQTDVATLSRYLSVTRPICFQNSIMADEELQCLFLLSRRQANNEANKT